MSTGMKTLNVFCIIFAWIFSILLVILLAVAPLSLSAMSVANPSSLAQTVGDMEIPQLMEMVGQDLADPDNGDLAELLSTNAAQELYDIYITNVQSILDGSIEAEALTEETIQSVVHNNIDELYQLALAKAPELGSLSEEEAKQQLEEELVVQIKEATASLPTRDELKETLTQDPTMDAAFQAIGYMDTAKLILIGVIVLLAVLVFVCRLFGFRGFRWLAVDLFVATGLSGIVCIGLTASLGMIRIAVADSPVAAALMSMFSQDFTTGAYIRTGIMLVAAVLLLVAYILIKKAQAKKAAPMQENA